MCAPRLGAPAPPTSTRWTSTVRHSRGSTYVAILATGRPGVAVGYKGARSLRTAGVCDVADDPCLDAREAHPLWLTDDTGLLHVCAAQAHHATADAAARSGFDLWRIPGRKRLHVNEARDAILTISAGARQARIQLDAGLGDGSPFLCTVPLTSHLRGQLAEFQALAGLLEGNLPPRSLARPVTRTSLLHLRALQALDAIQAKASHRDLAVALFGPEAVRAQWHADGALRAQVRHLVSRARGCVQGGYLVLAGVRPERLKNATHHHSPLLRQHGLGVPRLRSDGLERGRGA